MLVLVLWCWCCHLCYFGVERCVGVGFSVVAGFSVFVDFSVVVVFVGSVVVIGVGFCGEYALLLLLLSVFWCCWC